MKLTNSKNAKQAKFYRDSNKGYLLIAEENSSEKEINPKKVIGSNQKDGTNKIVATDEVFKSLQFKRSYTSKILFNAENSKKSNKLFNDFVDKLVNNKDTKFCSFNFKKEAGSVEKFKSLINKHFTSFGKNLRCDNDSPTLETLLIRCYNGEDIEEDFKLLQKRIKNIIEERKGSLLKSIEKNKIPFSIEENELKPSNDNMKWLFSLLTNDKVDKGIFDKFKEDYKSFIYNTGEKTYCGLEEVTKEICDNFFNEGKDGSTVLARKLYKSVLSFNYVFLEKYKENKEVYDSYKYFTYEIRNHFKKYFPIKKKNSTQKKIDKRSVKKNAYYYISSDFMFDEVWRHIVNKLVQGLIQYGKLKHYFYDKNSGWQKDKINSYGLSEIQIEEAFKKQMFLSIAWGATRLNYFFNFGSQNNPGNNNNQGDILLGKEFRSEFYSTLRSDGNSLQMLRDKLSTCFPIEKNDTTEQLINLLEITTLNLYNIRNNIFHYKNNDACNILNGTKVEDKNVTYDIEIIKTLFNRDLNSIQSQFKEKIRGSGLTDYYSFDTLKKVFTEDIKFYLYASQFPMFPSFKKVFTRGCNLKVDTTAEVRWYRDDLSKQDNQANLVYKNLLQLIYYNSFLPDINEDESIVTNWIDTIIDWNKDKAKNNKNKHQYKYANMPMYESNIKLTDYLENLWRLQSLKENEESKDKSKGNYYVDFVIDIFVKAFNEYLENKLESEYNELVNPIKQNTEENNNVSEDSLDKLFDEQNPILTMQNKIGSDIKCLGFYLMLRLLDSRELNKLLHQFIKYRTAIKETSTEKEYEERKPELNKFEELIALVQFTIPKPKVDDFYKKSMDNYFKEFIDGDLKNNFKNFYYNESKTEDKNALILHKSAYMVARSGALPLYCDMFAKSNLYKISSDDLNGYCKFTNFGKTNDVSERTTIEEKQINREEIHKTLTNNKKKISFQEKNKLIDEYIDLNNEIQNYISLREKLTFESLYQIHQLHVDILSRLASFAEDWERDMFFLLTALNSVNDSYKNIDVDKIFNEGEVVAKLTEVLKDNKIREIFNKLCWCHETFGSAKEIERRMFVRNSVAHLNHMSQYREHGIQPNIIELINKLRFLLAYDIKRQNAVTKAIKDLLEKEYKIKISFSRNDKSSNANGDLYNVFKLNKIESAEIIHLKNCYIKKDKKLTAQDNQNDKGIKFPAQNEFMINLVKQLLEFKY